MNSNIDHEDKDENVQVIDFLRDIESSAKKILRDPKRDGGNKLCKTPVTKQCEVYKGGPKIKSQSNSKELHERLKMSPFYESWKDYNDNRHMQQKKGHDSIEETINIHGCKDKIEDNGKDRYDMKVHLQSSYLRQRFRCDQHLSRQEDENKFASQLKSDESISLSESSTKHPLSVFLSNHVDTIASRFKTRTKHNQQSKEKIDDIEKCWMVNKEGLSRSLARMKNEEDKNRIDYSCIKALVGDNCQLQSVPIDIATKGFITKQLITDCKKIEDQRLNVDDMKTQGCTPPSRVPKLTPECWQLLIFESMSNGKYKMSIRKIKERCIDDNGNHQQEYWVIDLYDSYDLLRRFVLVTDEVKVIIKNSIGTDNKPKSTSQNKKCVYSQDFTRSSGDIELSGECSVTMYQDGISTIAMLRFDFDDTETHYGLTRTDPVEIHIPVYEIMTRIRKNYTFKASDNDFWFSESNGQLIWKPLLDLLSLNVLDSKTNKGIQHQSIEILFQNTTTTVSDSNNSCTIDNVQWVQPSVVDSNAYLTALRNAFELFSCFDSIFTSQRNIEIQQIGGFDCVCESRKNAVAKLENEMVTLPPLSLRLLGKRAFSKTLIPGACTIGASGSWCETEDFDDIYTKRNRHTETSVETDLTQPVAYFNKESSKKGISSTKVTMSLAFEKHALAPSFYEFDDTQITPSLEDEDDIVDSNIPTIMAKGGDIFTNPLDSRIDEWRPSPIIICDEPSTFHDKKWCLEHSIDSLSDPNNEIFQSNGFRMKCQAHPFKYNDVIRRQTFGISKNAASPNQTKVNSRMRTSSTEVCNYLLSKERGPEDFFHLIQNKYTNKDGGYINEPLVSLVYMTAYETKYVKGIKLKECLDEERRNLRSKQLQDKETVLKEKILSADKIISQRRRDELIKDGISGLMTLESEPNDAHRESKNEDLNAATENSESITIQNSNDTVSINDHTTLKGYGWRILPKAILGADFFELNKHKIQTCIKGDLIDKCNTPRMIGKVVAKECIKYEIDNSLFKVQPKSQMITDILNDRIQKSQSILEQQKGRKKLLSSNQQEALEYILNIPLTKSNDVTTTGEGENTLTKKENMDEESHKEIRERSIIENSMFMKIKRERDQEASKVIVSVKCSNYDALKEIIDDGGVDVDIYDEFGNTLFIIACQQGNKKMCKFLLRRGAHINAQNHAGNSGLHYLYEYGHTDLADYLLQKGADDSFLNAEGLTCYEGVSRTNLDAL